MFSQEILQGEYDYYVTDRKSLKQIRKELRSSRGADPIEIGIWRQVARTLPARGTEVVVALNLDQLDYLADHGYEAMFEDADEYHLELVAEYAARMEHKNVEGT